MQKNLQNSSHGNNITEKIIIIMLIIWMERVIYSCAVSYVRLFMTKCFTNMVTLLVKIYRENCYWLKLKPVFL